jgi:hypothetical protein
MTREFFLAEPDHREPRGRRARRHGDGAQPRPGFFGIPADQAEGWEAPRRDGCALLQSRLTVADLRHAHRRDQDHGRRPDRAAAISNAVADAYIAKTIEDRMGSTDSAQRWLGERLDSLRGELESSELALHSFKRQHNVLSVSMEDRQNLVASDIRTSTRR